MEARHGAARAAEAGPERTEPPEHAQPPAGHDEALANLREGLPIAGDKTFRQHTLDDGSKVWVDEKTGETHAKIPG